MFCKLGFLFAALIVTTQGKLLGKLLGGSSGCGSSGLQFPRLNLLSMLCRPTMSSWATPGYGASWGMGSFSQYPGYGGSYGSSYPNYGGYGTPMTGYGGYGYGGSSYGSYGGQGYNSPWIYSPSSWYNQQRKGREFIPKSPAQVVQQSNSFGKYNPPVSPSKSSVNTNEIVQQQMQTY